MRDSVGSSVRATVRLSMLYPREPSKPVTRNSAPGLFSSNTEIICSIKLSSEDRRNRLSHLLHHAAQELTLRWDRRFRLSARAVSSWHGHRLGRTHYHLIDCAASGHHRVHVLRWRDLHVQQIGS